ncbi:MAG: alpha/beta hydrolase [Phycisphaerae bacterium]|nr:alpha/beta hydrolase [Phycisphaerae bacterium]
MPVNATAIALALIGVLLPGCGSTTPSAARESEAAGPRYGLRLEGFDYPFPVRSHKIEFAGQRHAMAYMDIQPDGAPKGTVVLLHGKNFSGAYWERTARDLQTQGFRVVMPDQLGFGKSDKPLAYQYSFAGLASNTRSLLEAIGVERAIVLGHSMGGMLATRFALMYPEVTDKLVLVNPIGLEDWAERGVPYRGLEAWYRRGLALDAEGVKRYQLESYYDGDWEPEYQRWVDMLAGLATGPGADRFAAVQAQTYDMVYSQPVVHDFPRLSVPTLLIIGQRDRTSLGKDLVSEELRDQMGRYPELGRAAARSIPGATLVEIEGVGHLPHIERYESFIAPLEAFLETR